MTTRILFVEDNKAFRELAKDALTNRGHDIVAVPSGEEGLEMLKVAEFDLVLVDLGLPVMDGPEFIRQVRQQNERLGIVVLTCWDRETAVESVEGMGVTRVLSKPTSLPEIEAAIKDVANVTAKQDALAGKLNSSCDRLRAAREKLDSTTDFKKRS